MEELTLVEQIMIILEQNETELAYRADGIDPNNYHKVAECIADLFEQIKTK